MGRNGLTKLEKDQIILMAATGESTKEIAKQIEVSEVTIRKYKNQFKDEIEAKKAEITGQEPPKEHKPKGGYKPPPKDTEEANKTKPKEAQDPIEAAAKDKSIRKGSDFASDVTNSIYKDMVNDGKTIMSARLKYQTSLEQMGVDWNKFLNFAIEIGYEEIEKEYMRELERFRDEQAIALELEEQLHQQEVSEIETGQINFDDILRMESEQENE